MNTAKVFYTGRSQAVRIPRAFRFKDREVSIRREGEVVILEPLRKGSWPRGFWSRIRIGDAAFARPSQGTAPRRRGLERDP
jgi:virulence-associated protein VagC